MEVMRKELLDYVSYLPLEKIQSALDYIKFLSEQPTPLDDFDYELLERSKTMTAEDRETIPIEQAAKEMGVNYDEL